MNRRQVAKLAPADRLQRMSATIGDCIEWLGSRNREGYGQLTVQGRHWLAHRLAWEIEHGQIPKRMTIDHTCFNRACVNTTHMEVVTQGENNRRGWARRRMTAKVA